MNLNDVEFYIVIFNGRWEKYHFENGVWSERWIYDTYKFVKFENAYRFFLQAACPKDLQLKYKDSKYIFSLGEKGLDDLKKRFYNQVADLTT